MPEQEASDDPFEQLKLDDPELAEDLQEDQAADEVENKDDVETEQSAKADEHDGYLLDQLMLISVALHSTPTLTFDNRLIKHLSKTPGWTETFGSDYLTWANQVDQHLRVMLQLPAGKKFVATEESGGAELAQTIIFIGLAALDIAVLIEGMWRYSFARIRSRLQKWPVNRLDESVLHRSSPLLGSIALTTKAVALLNRVASAVSKVVVDYTQVDAETMLRDTWEMKQLYNEAIEKKHYKWLATRWSGSHLADRGWTLPAYKKALTDYEKALKVGESVKNLRVGKTTKAIPYEQVGEAKRQKAAAKKLTRMFFRLLRRIGQGLVEPLRGSKTIIG